MSRKPRMYLPAIPTHVVQRGNNRDVCFFADDDYPYYLEVLTQGCQRYDVQLYVTKLNHSDPYYIMERWVSLRSTHPT